MLRVAMLTALIVACSAPPPATPAASDTTSVERSFTVQPGELVEANIRLPTGTTATGRFEASAALAWNTHSHPGGKVVTHSEGTGATGELVLTATTADVYSMMWENKTDAAIDLRVTLGLPAGASMHSWHPK